MRLTLRTLLAYMDDILEPEDREDLRAKIENSEFASDLLHRARDVMRRLRLGAVAVTDARKGMDANSVAEYLDNTMPPEQVADFERLCLESDMQLAEVGSCHQILTMVLGEPADVRPEARARMYDVPAEADLRAIPASAVEDGPPPSELPRSEVPRIDVARMPSSRVPDYLRESFFERHGGKLIVAALLLIGGVAFLLWQTEDPPVPREVAKEGVDRHVAVPVIDPGDDATADGMEGESDASEATDPFVAANDGTQSGRSRYDTEPLADGRASAAEAAAEDGVDPPLEAEDIDTIPAPPPGLTDEAARSGDETPPADEAAVAPEIGVSQPSQAGRTLDESSFPQPPVPSSEPPSAEGADRTVVGEEPTEVAATAAPSDTPPADQEVAVDGSTTTEASSADEGVTTTSAVVDSPSGSQPEHVATYISRGEMLLRYGGQTDGWRRLPPLAQLHKGDELLALPASRPFITLPTTNLSVQLQPATRVVLAADETAGTSSPEGNMAPAGLTVQYGRVVMFNPARAGNWVAVRLGLRDSVYIVELDGESEVGVDVRRELPPGVNPLENSGILVADLFVSKGQVRWQTPGASAQTINPLAHWQIRDDQVGPVESIATEPRWISEDTVSPIDRMAVQHVEPALRLDQPARVSLVELAAESIMRRLEVKSLVTQASVHIGDFEPFVKGLNDSSQSRVWDEHIATLRSAMALGPQVAEQIREAFRNYKGNAAGDELFRLLWGYSQEQLQGGALEQLIEYLDHESLDFRVLAFNNLVRATGKQLEYHPHDSPQDRERPIREWRRRLMENDLAVRPQGTG